MPVKQRSASDLQRLTPTERRVAKLVAAGQSNKDAARELSMQPGTLAGHVASIGYKFGVTSRPAKIHAALASGQIAPPHNPPAAPDFTATDRLLLRVVATRSENEQIARAMGIALAEVNSTVQTLVVKANAHNTSHLIGLGHAWGLLGETGE